MNASRTARDRARAELTMEIKNAARRQCGEVGADALSLRAVARELGMVSSALYRYFPSRDHLLTALIIDAYNAIGEAAEAAEDETLPPIERWCAIWDATRAWAKAHPHEYALIYGSPIPGYQAPQDTTAPASRVALALVRVVASAELKPAFDGTPPSPALSRQASALATALETELEPADACRLTIAWTQLFGMISFELFGQYVGSMDPADEFFAYSARQLAEFIGIR
ncbi:TetR/AcrR family transcriptional regulator [Amycolatopsis acidicola]|uniref:TetR/AcrR family transcriptional regulator n=1 Tax=Amycolatopsis acidicola TaxID=2596893 RepID=A0A5N0VJQ2_9PSEU|nr:TetR/AcrR family transcriptional regulator [Amycolatopsis acidicola]KAA9164921.1 TetR/AcrR family transcriptional regulator [Amycolatopsis acidicola]